MPLYFLIGRWGHGRRVYAATKFFLFTMLGSAFMLVAIVGLAVLAHAGDDGRHHLRPPQDRGEPGASTATTARWLFLGFAIAFAVKTPMFPFHTWLPDAHTEAPTAGSVDLAGVMLKLGTYGFLRYGLYLFPEASVYFAPLLLTLGVIGIIYGAVVAAMQKDLKRLVAYSSVSHIGLHRPRHVRPHHPGHRGRRPADGQPRHHRPAPCSSCSASSTSAATPTTSPSSAACRRSLRSSPGSSRW